MALGHANNVANLRTAINHVKTLGTTYAPKAAYLKTDALDALYAAGRDVLAAVDTQHAAQKLVVDKREVIFERLDDYVRRSLSALKVSGASEEVCETAAAAARKVTGDKTRTAPAAPAADGEEPPAPAHSTSQMGYDNRAANFDAYVTLLESIPDYSPNEAAIKIPALRQLADELYDTNQKSSVADSLLDKARADRDKVLYTNSENVVNSGKKIKEYLKSAFGASSPEYRQISKLEFRKYD